MPTIFVEEGKESNKSVIGDANLCIVVLELMGVKQAAMQGRYVAKYIIQVRGLKILMCTCAEFSLEQRQQEVAVERNLAVLLQCRIQVVREVTSVTVEKASLLHKVENHQAVEHKQGVGFTIAWSGEALDGGQKAGLFAFEA